MGAAMGEPEVTKYDVFTSKEIAWFEKRKLNETQWDDLIKERKKETETLVQDWTKKVDTRPLPTGFINVVLIGAAGGGKSQFGNLLLGRDQIFKSDSSKDPVTKTLQWEKCNYRGLEVNIFDLPGLVFEYESAKNAAYRKEYKKIILSALPKIPGAGVHVFVFVVSALNYRLIKAIETALEDCKVLKKKNMRHTIMVISHGDGLPEDTTIDEYVRKNYTDQSNDNFQKYIMEHVSQHMMITNSTATPYQQGCHKDAFFELVASRCHANNNEYYPIKDIECDLMGWFAWVIKRGW